MVDNNDSLFREVNEELRREQFAKLWERYGTYFIGFAVVVIALVAGAKYWEHQRLANANAAGAEYEAAAALMASGKTADAEKAFAAIAETGPKGYASLASLSQAGAYLKEGKQAEALAAFEKLAADGSADHLITDFARLQAASLRLGEADFTEIQNRLNPLLADSSSWRFIAREMLATSAVKAGKLDEARTTLTPLLADPKVSRSALERINRLMAKIATAELSKTPDPAPAATPAPATNPAPAGEANKPASAP
jgi:hypothetical protein